MKKIILFISISILILSCKKNDSIEPLFYSITAISSFEQDQNTLTELWSKITAMSESKSCTNSNDWLWIEYGDKPCGGPWGYIEYHKTINTADFLHKIDYYFNLNKKFNEKHGMASTCEIEPSPNSVKCENGEAILVY